MQDQGRAGCRKKAALTKTPPGNAALSHTNVRASSVRRSTARKAYAEKTEAQKRERAGLWGTRRSQRSAKGFLMTPSPANQRRARWAPLPLSMLRASRLGQRAFSASSLEIQQPHLVLGPRPLSPPTYSDLSNLLVRTFATAVGGGARAREGPRGEGLPCCPPEACAAWPCAASVDVRVSWTPSEPWRRVVACVASTKGYPPPGHPTRREMPPGSLAL